jgi:hypothetical protein
MWAERVNNLDIYRMKGVHMWRLITEHLRCVCHFVVVAVRDYKNMRHGTYIYHKTKQTPWPESASELYRRSDRRFSAKSVTTFCR